MPIFPEAEKLIWEVIIFAVFAAVCCILTERRFSETANVCAVFGIITSLVLIQSILTSYLGIMWVLTMLPLTAYLPFIICLYIFSKHGFFQTTSAWTVGVIAAFILKATLKISVSCVPFLLGGISRSLVITSILLLPAILIVFIVARYMRKPFFTYVHINSANWLLMCFPILMIFMLLSYFCNSTTDPILLVLLLLTSFSIFAVLARVLISESSLADAKENEKKISAKMQLQRREYEDLCKKIEADKIYRHDMRHHLIVLGGLAEKNNDKSITEYIEKLNGKLSDIEHELYCENATVNALLSIFIQNAKSKGCTVKSSVVLPNELPFDELDICVVLANALENAVNACIKIYETDKRCINLKASFKEEQKLLICVTNPCKDAPVFDENGLPVSPSESNHGIGLQSVDTIVKKYNGIFNCEFSQGTFKFKAVMFKQPAAVYKESRATKAPRTKKVIYSSLFSLFTLMLVISSVYHVSQMPPSLAGVGNPPPAGESKSHKLSWGNTVFSALLPSSTAENEPDKNVKADNQTKTTIISQENNNPSDESESADNSQSVSFGVNMPNSSSNIGNGETVPPIISVEPNETESSTDNQENTYEPTAPPENNDANVNEINNSMESYISQMHDKFLYYAARKYNGYVNLEVNYKIIRNDENLLAIRFDSTLNVGGSSQYSRIFSLDKRNGSMLELSDLFNDDSSYAKVISEEILRQMTERNESANHPLYYIPGTVPDDDCFKQIDSDQNFYINDDNSLVVVFDEYTVAPGSAGMPEFIIPTDVLTKILKYPSLIE